ncbi:hypothetical protein DFJ77DRAFT_340318 [Powellomyces hirtus]|nr:hypothetical protein DFJ77DRAFT_340318 [Powellomyces hirtus]
MQAYPGGSTFSGSPFRTSTSTHAPNGTSSLAFNMFSATQLEHNYGLGGLEDKECIAKLLTILEGKETEVERLKRALATRNYDVVWDRHNARARNRVATQQQQQQRGGDGASGQGRTQQGTAGWEEWESFAESVDTATSVDEDATAETGDGGSRCNNNNRHPFRAAEQKLVASMKARIRGLEDTLAEKQAECDTAAKAYQAEIETLRHRVRALEEEREAWLHENGEVRRRCVELEDELRRRGDKRGGRSSPETTTPRAAAAAAAASSASDQKLRTRVRELEQRVRELEDELERTRTAATNPPPPTTDTNTHQKHMAALTQRIRDLENELANVNAVAIASPDRRGSSSSNNNNNNNPATTPPAHKSSEQKLVLKLMASIHDLESKLAAAQAHADAVADRVPDPNVLLTLKSTIRQLHTKLERVERERDAATRLVDAHTRGGDHHPAWLDTDKKRVLALQATIDETQTRLEDVEEELEIVTADKQHLEATLRLAQTHHPLTTRTNDRAATDQKLVASLRVQITHLEHKVALLQGQLQQQQHGSEQDEAYHRVATRVGEWERRARDAEARAEADAHVVRERAAERAGEQKTVRDLKAKVTTLEGELEREKEAAESAAAHQHQTTSETIRTLTSRLAEREAALEAASAALRERTQEKAAAQTQATGAKTQLRHLETQLLDAHEQLENAVAETSSAAQARLEEAASRLALTEAALQKAETTARQQGEQDHRTIQTLRATVREVEARCTELEAEKSDVSRARDGDQRTIQTLRATVREVEARCTELEAETSNVSRARDGDQRTIQALRATVRELEARCTELEAEESDVSRARDGDQRTIQTLRTTVRELEARCTELEAEVSDVSRARDGDQRTIQALRATVREVEARWGEMEAQLEDAKQHAESEAVLVEQQKARVAIEELTQQLAVKEEALREVETNRRIEQREADQRESELKGEIRRLEARLQDMRDEIADAVAMQQQTAARADNVADQHHDVTTRLADAEAALAAARSAAHADQNTIQQLNATITHLQAERDRANAALHALAASEEHVRIRMRALEERLAEGDRREAGRKEVAVLKQRVRELEARLEGVAAGGRTRSSHTTMTHNNKINHYDKEDDANRVYEDETSIKQSAETRKAILLLKTKIRELQARLEDVEAVAAADAAAFQARIHVLEKSVVDKTARLRAYESITTIKEGQTKTYQLDVRLGHGEQKENATLDALERQYEELRMRLHALAEEIQMSVLDDAMGPSQQHHHKNRESTTTTTTTTSTPFRSINNTNKQRSDMLHTLPKLQKLSSSAPPAAKAAAIASAFRSIYTVLGHLAARFESASAHAAKQRGEIRKTVGTLKRARADVALAQQARTALVERVKELETQCRAKVEKLKLVDELMGVKEFVAAADQQGAGDTEHNNSSSTDRHRDRASDGQPRFPTTQRTRTRTPPCASVRKTMGDDDEEDGERAAAAQERATTTIHWRKLR